MEFSRIKLQMVKEQNFQYNNKEINTPIDVVKFINEIEELNKATEENVLQICLNTKNEIIGYMLVAKGGIASCEVDLKTIFKNVLLCNGNKFILVHNHPSENLTPSRFDIELTKRIDSASNIMQIQFLDHIIISGNDYVSIKKIIKN